MGMDGMSIMGIEPLRDKKLRIAAYARFNKRGSDGRGGHAAYHLEAVRKEADSNLNWTLVDIYIDTGIDDPYSCPESRLQDLLTDCRDGKIDIIFVCSIEKLTRNTGSFLRIVDELSRLEPPVCMHFEIENLFTLDENNNPSEFMKLLMSAMKDAEEETRQKAEKPKCYYTRSNG